VISDPNQISLVAPVGSSELETKGGLQRPGFAFPPFQVARLGSALLENFSRELQPCAIGYICSRLKIYSSAPPRKIAIQAQPPGKALLTGKPFQLRSLQVSKTAYGREIGTTDRQT
jgi:hypothetical protein